jgi:hypothetical protein
MMPLEGAKGRFVMSEELLHVIPHHVHCAKDALGPLKSRIERNFRITAVSAKMLELDFCKARQQKMYKTTISFSESTDLILQTSLKNINLVKLSL